MPWLRVEKTEGERMGQVNDLFDDFEKLWMAKGAPRLAALFESRDSMKEGAAYYFSPDAGDLCKASIGSRPSVECAAPHADSVVPLISHAGIEDELLA